MLWQDRMRIRQAMLCCKYTMKKILTMGICILKALFISSQGPEG